MRPPERIGRYQIQSVIGVGGFAVVYRAHDEALDDAVAVKVLADNWVADPEIRSRFLEEARLLRRLKSDHVVTVHDVGELADGQPYFVMEFANRGNVADRLAARRSAGLDPASARELVTALTGGLGALHRAGIVHRDVNPRNLLLRAEGAPIDVGGRAARSTQVRSGLIAADEKLLLGDLGLAKDIVRTGRAASLIGGTPHYHAPEQLDPDAPVRPAADIFAATGVVWEAITGTQPPRPDDVRRALEVVDERWHEFFGRGLASDPDERFEDMDAWREAVLVCLGPDLAAAGGASVRAPARTADVPPYKGLASFQPEDAARFFGRDALVAELVDRLGRERTLMVAGPSGSGKSSLVRAGLIPAVAAGGLPGSARWPVALLTPRTDPVGELGYQLSKTARSATQQAGVMEADPAVAPLQARYVAETLAESNGGLLLVIDQFEELFTQCPSTQDRERFLELLASIVDPADSRTRLVLAMRADFFGACALHPWLARRISQNQVLVGPMSRSELREAIEGPARVAGLRLEDGLVDAVLDDGGGDPGSLPLVSHALAETWRHRRDTMLGLNAYRTAGGVAGALAQTADVLYERLDDVQRGAARRLMLRLVAPGEGTSDTRRTMPLVELPNDPQPDATTHVARELTDARLLTVDRDTIEITHEALLQAWPLLRRWIEESRDDLRARQRIDRAGAEWESAGREQDLLYRGIRLQAALEWAAEHAHELSAAGRELLEASSDAWKRSEEQKARSARRTRRIRRAAVAALAALTTLAVGAWIVALSARNQATARYAQSLATQAASLADDDPRLALALAVESIAAGAHDSLEARGALVDASRVLRDGAFAPARSAVNAGDALSVAISSDGKVVATGLRDGTVRLWDPSSGRPLGRPLEGHTKAVQGMAFSADGRFLLTGSHDATVRRWDVADPSNVPSSELLGSTTGVVWDVAVNSDGTTVATASEDGAVLLWDARSRGVPGEPLATTGEGFLAVAFSPDGTRLLAGDASGQFWGWTVPGRERVLGPIAAHASDLWEIEFHPSGESFATRGADGRIQLWRTATGERIVEPFAGRAADLRGVQISRDGSLLLAGDEDGRTLAWSLTDSREVATSGPGHAGQVIDSSLAADADVLATLSLDHTVRVWTRSRDPLGVVLSGHEGGAFGLAVSPDGERLATGDGTGAVRVFDVDSGELLLGPLTGHTSPVWALDFSGDASRLASGSADGTVLVHDARTGEELARTAGHRGRVSVVRFDGDRLLSGGDDGVVRVWSATGKPAGEPFGSFGGGVTDMTPGPGDTLLVSDAGGAVTSWDLGGTRAGEPVASERNTIWGIALSRDRRVLATASADEVVTLQEVGGRASRTRRLTPHRQGATAVAFLADRVTAVTAARDGAVRLWDVTLGRSLGEPVSMPGAPVWRVVSLPHDDRFVTSSQDGTVVVWDVLDVGRACERSGGAFDSDQRRRFLGTAQAAAGCR